MSKLPATFVKGFHDENVIALMEYRTLGLTNLELSKISFGGGPLSPFYGELDVNEAIKAIHQSLKYGINYIDTAPYYGQGRSEEILGMALKDIPRKAYYIATKVGRYTLDYETMFDYSAKKTRESVMKSLELLGLDYVDIIQIHDIEFAKDLNVVINECLPELEKLVKEGKAKYIGVTGYPLSRLKECIEKAPGRFDVVLSYARNTLLDRSLEDYMDFFQKQDVGVICASGHAMGLLTNNGPQPWHPAGKDIRDICRKAADICNKNCIELGKLAMYFCLQFNGVATNLAGMQTRELLESNLSACKGLNSNEQEILKDLRKTIFTKSVNWEGIELKRYWEAIDSNK